MLLSDINISFYPQIQSMRTTQESGGGDEMTLICGEFDGRLKMTVRQANIIASTFDQQLCDIAKFQN